MTREGEEGRTGDGGKVAEDGILLREDGRSYHHAGELVEQVLRAVLGVRLERVQVDVLRVGDAVEARLAREGERGGEDVRLVFEHEADGFGSALDVEVLNDDGSRHGDGREVRRTWEEEKGNRSKSL
jgi:hypothetical protein